MSDPGTVAFVDLLDRARHLLSADRIEVALAGGPPVVVGTAAYDVEPVAHLQVADEEGPLVELLAYGGNGEPDQELLCELAAVAAAVAGRERTVSREEVCVGRLGHDLKTPLTAVLGFSGLLAGGGVAGASPALAAAATDVVETGERLLDELQGLLTHWRRPHG